MGFYKKEEVLLSLKEFKVSNRVTEQYLQCVKGCKGLTRYQIKLKLFRNVLLGFKYKQREGDIGELFAYGNLQILIVNNKVVHIDNRKSKPSAWIQQKEKYDELNKILGINF